MRSRHPVFFSLALIVVCSLIAGANPLPVVAASTTYHVSTAGTDTGGCGSEATPCRTLQYAVNLAQSGDILKVAAGTYTRSSSPPSTDCTVGSANADPVVCFINKHLTMVGGYSTGNWSTSNPAANPTVIDGQNSHRGVSVIGWSSTSATASLIMEGFTIRQGLALGATSGEDWVIGGYGGGLYATNAPVTLRHIIFESNRAVGGNTGQAYGGTAAGGALGLNGMPTGTMCILEDVTFSGNQALGGQGPERGGTAIGGGLYTDTANIHGSDLGFFNNLAHAGSSAGSGRDSVYGWTADGLGGGAAIHVSTDAALERVTASGNQAVGGDGGVQAGAGHGGALYAEQAVLVVEKADLRQNKAMGGNAVNGYVGGGGALMASESTISLKQSTIVANEAWGGNGTTGLTGAAGGGGLYLIRLSSQPSTITISNSIIANNLATEGQGAQVSGGGGGGLWLQGVDVDFVHTTIARNRLGETLVLGAGAILVSFSCAQPTVADMNYSIIEGHSDATAAALHVWEGNTLNLYRSLFAANTRDTNGASSVFPPGTITGMSTCLEAGSADFVSPGAPNYNYHLLDSSAAIDQAIGSTTPLDIDGDARPVDGVADIGADEATLVLGLVLGVRRPESGTLVLSWQLAPSLLSRLDHYELVVTAEAGASSPNEGRLGSPIDVGQQTEFTLTGLTDGKEYRMQLVAYDGADSSLADTTATARPMSLSHTFLPLTLGD